VIEPQTILLIPGLNCSARLYAEQIPELWRLGPVTIAEHRHDDTMAGIARRILRTAPPRFALIGLSMGGYVAFEIMRQAPDRVRALVLLDTAAPADTPEQTQRRRAQIDLVQRGRFSEIPDLQLPQLVHRARRDDPRLQNIVRQMAEETGSEAFVRQQKAIMSRPDARPDLGKIACPTLVLVGDGDELTPPERAREIAAGISGSRLVIVPDCGHLSTLERPEAVNEVLLEWLQQHAKAD
jgi:pimeloyl-ACP methyl ester carboxylesterase